MTNQSEGEQLALVRAGVKRTRQPSGHAPALSLPVARVVVDVSLPHLDRPFDYLVPRRFDDSCVPGARVRVRFAGQDLDAFVLDRVSSSEHTGRLAPVRRVVSAEPVLTPEVARLARGIADRYAGTLADVLRLAIPPRHARTENEALPGSAGPPDPDDFAEPGRPWADYDAGPGFLRALAEGSAPRAVWTALPVEAGPWPEFLAHAAGVMLAAGRGVLLIVPDQRDVARLDEACATALGPGRHVALTAGLGPAERYRRFLAARRGHVRCVIGTRAAAFAPVPDLGLVGCWDDGDDLHAEPRAPYPHAREVLLVRTEQQGAAALVGGFACTAESAQLLATGWAQPLTPSRGRVRAVAPRVEVAGQQDAEVARDPAARSARLPHRAFEIARAALSRGPVLVQVPRSGYVPALACQDCRTRARCERCSGPLAVPSARETPQCQWCGRLLPTWRCQACGGTQLRAPVVGAHRTAEELGRAFPAVAVRASGGSRVLEQVGAEPALVVATPGAEPIADSGYAAALLLDTGLILARRDLRVGEEAVRRWMGAAALVRAQRSGGAVVAVGDPASPELQALVRWGPVAYAERELADRRAAGFPPAVRLATVEGTREAVAELADLAELPSNAEVLGPVPIDSAAGGPAAGGTGVGGTGVGGTGDGDGDGVAEQTVRLVVRSALRDGVALAASLQKALGVRSARKAPGTVRVRVNPRDLD